MKITFFIFYFLFFVFRINSQIIPLGEKTDSVDLTFKGTSINPYEIGYEKDGKLVISGYLDVYGAH